MLPSYMTSTANRACVGQRVWCHDAQECATVIQASSLGLTYSPLVQTDSGNRILYCGSTLSNCCNYILEIVDAMKEQGATDLEVQCFRNAWFQKTNRETQRAVYVDALREAKLKDTLPVFFKSIKNNLGVA